MKKYLLLITISLALIVTTIVAALVFRPTSQLNTSGRDPVPHSEDSMHWFTTVSYSPDVQASYSSRGALNGPAVFLNFPNELDADIEFTLVNEVTSPGFVEGQPAMCTDRETPDQGYSSLQEQANQSYWQQVKVWLIPATGQVTLAQDIEAPGNFVLVKGGVDQWHSDCPMFIDEDV